MALRIIAKSKVREKKEMVQLSMLKLEDWAALVALSRSLLGPSESRYMIRFIGQQLPPCFLHATWLQADLLVFRLITDHLIPISD